MNHDVRLVEKVRENFRKKGRPMTQIFAHRGSSGTHPENTMVSYIEAERLGADGLELDAQMTKDGELVVLHDERVNRTTNGKGWVKNFTLKELKELSAGSWFKKKYHDAQIPTVKEVLDWARGNELLLNIELKTGVVKYPDLEQKVIDMVKEFGVKERIILSSFNHYSMQKAHMIDPTVETAILYMEGLFEPWKYARKLGASGLHCYWPAAAPELIDGAKRENIAIRPFTVNKETKLKAFLKAGCTGIFTDWPEKALKIREKL